MSQQSAYLKRGNLRENAPGSSTSVDCIETCSGRVPDLLLALQILCLGFQTERIPTKETVKNIAKAWAPQQSELPSRVVMHWELTEHQACLLGTLKSQRCQYHPNSANDKTKSRSRQSRLDPGNLILESRLFASVVFHGCWRQGKGQQFEGMEWTWTYQG